MCLIVPFSVQIVFKPLCHLVCHNIVLIHILIIVDLPCLLQPFLCAENSFGANGLVQNRDLASGFASLFV